MTRFLRNLAADRSRESRGNHQICVTAITPGTEYTYSVQTERRLLNSVWREAVSLTWGIVRSMYSSGASFRPYAVVRALARTPPDVAKHRLVTDLPRELRRLRQGRYASMVTLSQGPEIGLGMLSGERQRNWPPKRLRRRDLLNAVSDIGDTKSAHRNVYHAISGLDRRPPKARSTLKTYPKRTNNDG